MRGYPFGIGRRDGTMSTLQEGYRGATLLLALNWDRLLSVAILTGALMLGTWIGSLDLIP
jgi:hypothetical protein